MATVGQRGKWAEAQVRNWMKKRSDADAKFDFYRFPDARAGSMQAVPADFETCFQGTHALIEVKEIKVKTIVTRRLPSSNFSVDKIARMMKRRMAGAEGWVILCHMHDTLGARKQVEWRLAPVDYFKPGEASWDVSIFKTHATLKDLMLELFPEKK